jgi:sugar/nucleoside kinase (ribokinase family)
MRVLSVGHVARDEFAGEEGWRLGGTALYAAATSARLGVPTTLVTRVGQAESEALARRCADLGVELHTLPTTRTTTFAFAYDADGHRHLKLRARARGIALADVPARLRAPDAAILATIAHELSHDLIAGLGARVSILVAQGLLRAWDADGTIRPREWEDAPTMLARVSAAVMSEEDLAGDLSRAAGWSAHGPVVVTLAERGARVYSAGRSTDVAGSTAARVVDPTGAGDAFAAALAIGLAEGHALVDAVRFANAAASFAVEDRSTDGLADRARVEARLAGG